MKQYEHTQHTDHHYNRHGARAGWSIWIWVFVSVCEYVLDALSHLLMQLDSVFRKGGFWFREPPWGLGVLHTILHMARVLLH